MIGKRYGAEIIVQEWSCSTGVRIARRAQPGPALAPEAGTPEVSSAGGRQENIRAVIQALRVALEAPPQRRELREVAVVADGDEQVGRLVIEPARRPALTPYLNTPTLRRPHRQ